VRAAGPASAVPPPDSGLPPCFGPVGSHNGS
jgi:hypothetical protein